MHLGEVIQLKKIHPCGSNLWTIISTGEYIGLNCSGCKRGILLTPVELERKRSKRQTKEIISKKPQFC